MTAHTEEGRRPARRAPVADLAGIRPVFVTRIADEVAERIRELIIQENLAEGSRLPSERDLAARFGASRPMVSQALRTLALMGMVEIRRGSGAYVLRQPATMVTASVNLMLDLDRDSVGHLVQLRLWLETLGVTELARREPPLNDYEASTLTTALHRLADAAGDMSAWIAADTVFHASIVRAAGNPYLGAMYESVHTAVLSYEFEPWVNRGAVPTWLRRSTRKTLTDLHRPILDAVLGRDSDAARVAVLRHNDVMLAHLRLVGERRVAR